MEKPKKVKDFSIHAINFATPACHMESDNVNYGETDGYNLQGLQSIGCLCSFLILNCHIFLRRQFGYRRIFKKSSWRCEWQRVADEKSRGPLLRQIVQAILNSWSAKSKKLHIRIILSEMGFLFKDCSTAYSEKRVVPCWHFVVIL